MAYKQLALTLAMIGVASPLSAAIQDPTLATNAPAGTAETRYCMHIEAITGSRLEKVRCWTREEWAEQQVDVDQDWAKEGVRTIG